MSFAEKDTDLTALYQLAISKRELGRYEEALSYWEKFITTNPDLPTAFLEMAINYSLTGRYQDALSSSKRALQLNPVSVDINSFYAKCEILVGNPETAINHLEHFLQNVTTYPMAIVTLALAYFCLGKKEKGLEYLEKLRSIKGITFNFANFFSASAKTLISAHRFTYALAVLQAAIENNYVNDDTSKLLAESYKFRFSEQNE
jgi:tetratricopeptide (TPR) repeat protein